MSWRHLWHIMLVSAVLGFAGCDRLFEKQNVRAIESADKKAAAGDFRAAIKLYESALDGTARTAEVHYKLAVIYEDKLRSPLDALHHFQRYLDLAPSGSHQREARKFKKEGEAKLVASLGKGNLISQEEAIRLRNENLAWRTAESLRKQTPAAAASAPSGTAKREPVQKPIPPGARTHTVRKGETLASISLKYYKTRAKWKDIQDANFNALEGTANIKPGQVLVIPESRSARR